MHFAAAVSFTEPVIPRKSQREDEADRNPVRQILGFLMYVSEVRSLPIMGGLPREVP
jgi:hypothetical protein